MAETDVSKPAEPPKPVHIGGDSIADRLLPHLKKIVIGVIVVAVVLSIFFGFRVWKQSKQAEQTEKVAKVLSLAQRPVAPATATPPPTPAAGSETFADPKARATAVLDEMAKQNTDATGSAYRGGLLLDAGKIDDAIAEYKRGVDDKGIMGLAAREGLGIALETKAMAEKDPAARQQLLEQALAAFVAMQPDDAGPRRGYALYHQARLQQVLGKTAEAKALYEQAKAKAEGSPELAALVERRLTALGAS